MYSILNYYYVVPERSRSEIAVEKENTGHQ